MKIRQFFKHKYFLRILSVIWVACICITVHSPVARAGCMDISDIPLDTQEQTGPGIIMFLIDDSGSMDWEMLCPELDGQFAVGGTKYSYVLANAGDNAYSSSDTNGKILEGSTAAMRWKSQWSGYNRMYYNPNSTYTPWPMWSTLISPNGSTQTPLPASAPNADPTTPRSNPVLSTSTLNLSNTYYNFAAPTIDQLINSNGIVVDNTREVIIDNTDSRFSTNPTNTYSRRGNKIYWTTSSSGGYDTTTGSMTTGSYAVTGNTQSGTMTATWQLSGLPYACNYDVYACWKASSTNTGSATYKIYTDTSVVYGTYPQSQTSNGNTWVLLASDVPLDSSSYSPRVTVSASTTTSIFLVADAIRLVPKTVSFAVTGPAAWTSASNTSAINGSYIYTSTVNTTTPYTATWTAKNLDAATAYDVYTRWISGTDRSTSVPYTVASTTPVTYTANQSTNNATWTKIASSVYFTGGVGTVKIGNGTTTFMMTSTNGKAVADAVAFVPSNVLTTTITVLRAHYFVQNDNGTYLVNLANPIEYYAFQDSTTSGTQDNVDPGELIRLSSTQAQAAGIVTGRSYTDERQNFANWYQFYRRRELTAKNGISNVIYTMTGVEIGIVTIHERITQRALPVHLLFQGTTYDSTGALLNTLYGYNSADNTPLKPGLQKVGRYFKGDYLKPAGGTSDPFPIGTNTDTYPFFLSDYGGECQQAFCIMMTDGYYNDDTGYVGTDIGNADGTGSTGFEGAPFADTYLNTLADVAMYYYKTDLNSTLNNFVPTSSLDKATFQHMVTYSMSFGLTGTLDRTAYPSCPYGGASSCPGWPDPGAIGSNNPEKIDDLWHAAVNGRGSYFNANTPEQMVDALNTIKESILSRLGTSSSLATNSVQRVIGSNLYQGTYHTQNWTGDLSARPVDVTTGNVLSAAWSASAQLDDIQWSDRTILSSNGTSGIFFQDLTSAQKALLNSNSTTATNIINYIRGDTSHNAAHGGTFRIRNSKLGDIVHSAPVYFKDVIYIGANDGMLHAFDANSGDEIFAYVPNLVIDHLATLSDMGYSHRYYVDNTPYVADLGSSDVLVCGLGKGGKGYFCLDVTNPNTESPSNVKWEYSAASDNDLGYTFSQAIIGKTNAAGYVVIFGNGYDSVNQHAVLYVLNVDTGQVIKKIDTGVGTCNGLSTPALVDVDANGVIDYVYAGDLKGNMWKFDFRGASVGSSTDPLDGWKVAFNSGTPQPLFTAQNASGQAQPITTSPEVMPDCANQDATGMMVMFGTGQYLGGSDFNVLNVQSIYGIRDWQPEWEKIQPSVAPSAYLGTFTTGRQLSNMVAHSWNATLLQQTATAYSTTWLVFTNTAINYYNPKTGIGSHMGWYFNLPYTRERITQDTQVRAGVLIAVSSIPSQSPCTAGGNSVIYQLDACSGGRTKNSQFDVNGDLTVNASDVINIGSGVTAPPSGQWVNKVLFAPIELGGMLYFNDSTGNIVPLTVPPNPSGVAYWQIIE